MIPNELWIIYALIFGAALLGIQSVYFLLFKSGPEQKAINRRLALTAQLSNPAAVLQVMRKERGVEFFATLPALHSLNKMIIQSAIRLTPLSVGLMLGIPGALTYLGASYAFRSGFLAILLAPPVSIAAMFLFLQFSRRRRIAAFSEQLPDAIDVIVRGLRAGHPFRVALGLVSREMPDPVGSEFGIIADEISFGLDQAVAVSNLQARVGQEDLAFFAIAVNIQHQTGGNLAEILTRLSRMLRNRMKLRLKVRALSSEGRLSAIALSATPFVLFGIVTLISRDFFFGVKDHPIVVPALAVGALMLIIGNVLLYRMVNFRF